MGDGLRLWGVGGEGLRGTAMHFPKRSIFTYRRLQK